MSGMNGTAGQPLVTVVIPAYNAAPYIGEAIDTVRAQTYRWIQVIVIDDGSNDGTGDVVRRFGPSIRYVRQRRGGTGAARNLGVAMAGGSFLAFLDADDRYPPQRIARQIAAFDDDPELQVVYGHVREFVSPDLEPGRAARLRRPASRAPGLISTAMLARPEVFSRVGPFAEHLTIGVDLDWYARMAESGLRTHMLPDIVLERRLHSNNSGLRERASRTHYVEVLKAALDRRREVT